MSKEFTCTIYKITKGETVPHRISLEKITAEERKGKELLGKANGPDLSVCVFMGAKYGENFVQKARWYYISNETDEHLEKMRRAHPNAVRVEFYGEKIEKI